MIKGILVFIFLLTLKFSFAQENAKEFYSEDDVPVTEHESYYYLVGNKVFIPIDQRKITWQDTVYVGTVKAYYTESNKLKSTLLYVKGERQGSFTEYYENGALKEKGVYVDDKKAGNDSSWHVNGQLQKILSYYTVDREYGWKESKFLIVDYWDASGNQLVKSGNGNCVCLLSEIKPFREEGKVVSGKKDQLWKAFSGDTLTYEEQYKVGEFVKGVSYRKGQTYPYTEVQQMAEMPGGVQALMKFLVKNIRYPREARRRGMEGKVFVKFMVDKEGQIIEPEVMKGFYPSLDEEAVRVVKLLDRWTPGKLRGIPVKSQFVLPIYFKLDY
jgi:TonB family protein